MYFFVPKCTLREFESKSGIMIVHCFQGECKYYTLDHAFCPEGNMVAELAQDSRNRVGFACSNYVEQRKKV